MNELQKIETFSSALAIAETFAEIKAIELEAEKYAKWAKAQSLALDKQNELGRFRVQIEAKKGEWLDKEFPHGNQKGNNNIGKVTESNLTKMPTTKRESVQAREIARGIKQPAMIVDIDPKTGDVLDSKPVNKTEAAMVEIENEGNVITPSAVNFKLKPKKIIPLDIKYKKAKDTFSSVEDSEVELLNSLYISTFLCRDANDVRLHIFNAMKRLCEVKNINYKK